MALGQQPILRLTSPARHGRDQARSRCSLQLPRSGGTLAEDTVSGARPPSSFIYYLCDPGQVAYLYYASISSSHKIGTHLTGFWGRLSEIIQVGGSAWCPARGSAQ